MANREQEVVVSGIWGTRAHELISHPGTINAYLALCLGGNISDSELRKYLEWAQQNTRHTYVLIDDYEFRYNRMVLGGVDEKTATLSVLADGANLARKAAGIIYDLMYPYKELTDQNIRLDTGQEEHRDHNLIIRRASKLLAQKDVVKELNDLQTHYNLDEHFRQAVHNQVQENLGPKFIKWAKTKTKQEVNFGLGQLSQFLLEELAISKCLIEVKDVIELSRESPMGILTKITLFPPEKYGHIKLKIASSQSIP